MPDIAIIGLSPLGIALGRAVRSGVQGISIAGFDPNPATGRRAIETGAVDDAPRSAAAALAGAKLVVLSSPMTSASDALRIIGEFAPSGCVVTDTCPLKAPLLRWAEERLPDGMHFVGGRPVPRTSNEGAEASFDDTDYAIIPSTTASGDAVEAVTGLAKAVGASPFFLDAAEHDSFVIATEYLPRIAAGAAVDAVSASPVWRDVRRLQGDAFSQALRTAAELDPEELAIVLECAPETLGSWLDRLAGATRGLWEAALAKPDAAEAAKRLAELIEARVDRLREAPPAHAPVMERQSFSSLLLGDWLGRRANRQR